MNRHHRNPGQGRKHLISAAILFGFTLALAGCGTESITTAKAAPTISPPSMSTLQHLLPKDRKIVRVATVRLKGQFPEDVVVSTGPLASPKAVSVSLNVSAVSWNQKTRHWGIIWRSPALSVQEAYTPGPAVIPAISAFKVHKTSKGALVGLLVPTSIGASTIWNDGLILWLPSHKSPHLLWIAHGQDHQLANGALTTTANGILVRQEACGEMEAVQTHGRAQLTTLSCTEVTAKAHGKRILFTAGPNGSSVSVVTPSITVTKGSTLVFWPNNAATKKLVNSGQLNLYGGFFGKSLPGGEVPLAAADSSVRWSYQFTTVGTYYFAIVPSNSPSFGAPQDITVTVTK